MKDRRKWRLFMEKENCLILIDGADRTFSVKSIARSGELWEIVYANSPQVYRYRSSRVQLLELQQRLDPAQWILSDGCGDLTQLQEIQDFGTHYRILRAGKRPLTYAKEQVSLERSCMGDRNVQSFLHYFRETADAVGLVTEDGQNLLSSQYARLEKLSSQSVLACYLSPQRAPARKSWDRTILYPFGLNQSQKQAVENALTSKISIIQGPPGTGKTQTILNIIANLVYSGQTVAVVSNNNSAIQNIAEKMEQKNLGFLTAFLGSSENKELFLKNQTGRCPTAAAWFLTEEQQAALEEQAAALTRELEEMLQAKNRVAAIEQELLELAPEEHYFAEYYAACLGASGEEVRGLSSRQMLELWLEYEQCAEQGRKPGLLKKLAIFFRFNFSALRVFRVPPEQAIPYLQRQFYQLRRQELETEKARLEQALEEYSFEQKMKQLSEESLKLFRANLCRRFVPGPRRIFEAWEFRGNSGAFNEEHPVILSTTYSIRGTLGLEHTYDYLIVDEASQVDLATGALALSCAKNLVVVGDLQQLPNVLDEQGREAAERVWSRYKLPEAYRYSAHSLLSSALAVWPQAPEVLLREHYRCHPKIINFCNQKFYGGKLIVLTEDQGEPDVLTMYRTAPGNHARGHLNQRQIDVIRQEVIPRLEQRGCKDIGIITPYRDQAAALQEQLGKGFEVATVHKFQGREKEAVVLTSVDNLISGFVDDPRMLNVAVSRAVRSLTVVTSDDPRNDPTNYGELARYIQYNNCEVVQSKVYSVFDLLYQGYAEQRRAFLKKYRRISEYDSENLLYTVLTEILQTPEFSSVACAVRVSLLHLVRDYSSFTEEETRFAKNPLAHVDFLLFRRIDRSPVLAIEADGTSFHKAGSVQAQRDEKKNHILACCGIPLLRLRTDQSGEKRRIEEALRTALHGQQ